MLDLRFWAPAANQMPVNPRRETEDLLEYGDLVKLSEEDAMLQFVVTTRQTIILIGYTGIATRNHTMLGEEPRGRICTTGPCRQETQSEAKAKARYLDYVSRLSRKWRTLETQTDREPQGVYRMVWNTAA